MTDQTKAGLEPVAWMSPGKERLEFSRPDTVYGSHTIPLYAIPPDAAAEIAKLRDLLDEQKGTIRALNMALAGEDSTSTENLVAAHEIDPGCAGLISLCMELRADVEPYQLLEQQLAAQAAALAKARDALRRLAKLGNGDRPGNSVGNCIAREALAAIDALMKGNE